MVVLGAAAKVFRLFREVTPTMGKIRALMIGTAMVVATLLCIGLVMVYSSTMFAKNAHFFAKQLYWVAISVGMMVVVAYIPRKWLMKFSWVPVVGVVMVLAYLATGALAQKLFGDDFVSKFPFINIAKGGVRWLHIGGYTLQPSELAKFALILHVSMYYGTRTKEEISRFFTGVGIPVLIGGMVTGLIFLGHDLSTTVVTAMTFGILMCLAGAKLRYLLLLAVVGATMGYVAAVHNPERLSRITSFKDPEVVKEGDGYQLWHALMAMGSGSMTGVGLTQGIMKDGYILEPHTDFIMAVLGEELGYLGVLGVLSLYLAFMVLVLLIGSYSRTREGMLLCSGVAFLCAIQGVVNIGVVSGWGPTTGLTAPFISYGGSSMLSICMCVGLVFNECREILSAMNQEMENTLVIPLN